jgi:AraC-like DNA-binding protein
VFALARSYASGTRLGWHAHKEAQLLYAASGLMQVTTPLGRWLVPPARAVWVPPLLEHAVDALTNIEMRTLYFDAAWLATHERAGGLGQEFVVRMDALVREVVLALFHATGSRGRLLGDLVLFELAQAADAATFIPVPSDPRARRVAEMVLADPTGTHDLDTVARRAGVSRRTISRLFPAETALSFRKWQQRARVLAAVELLGGGEPSIKAVAHRLGFSSVAAFSHAFRQVIGQTPTDFLAQMATGRQSADFSIPLSHGLVAERHGGGGA